MRLLLGLLMLSTSAFPADCAVKSGEHANALVELYTSEGCSSCPPADRWISSFARAPDPRVIPLAFHVHYWDYIGWKDAYADPRFTERQRDFARLTGASSVYTPQVVLDGRDYRRWSNERGVSEAIDRVKARRAAARLEISQRPGANGIDARISAQALAGAKAADLALVVAATQNGITTRVTAGENKGETLTHNFVVRGLKVARALSGDFRFEAKPDWKLERMSLVAFVQDVKTGQVLQALSAPVCR